MAGSSAPVAAAPAAGASKAPAPASVPANVAAANASIAKTGGVAPGTSQGGASTQKNAPWSAPVPTPASSTTATKGGDGGSDAAPSTPASPALLVSSTPSRNNYTQNVTTLQKATSNITNKDPSVVDYLNQNKMPSDFTSRAALAAQNGISGYVGSASQNTALLTALQKGGGNNTSGTKGTGASGGANSSGTATDTTKTPVTGADGKTATDPAAATGGTTNADGSITNSDGTITNPDGSTTIPNSDGSTTTINSDGSYTLTNSDGSTTTIAKDGTTTTTGADGSTSNSVISPSVMAAFNDSISSVNDEVTQAKANLASAQGTLYNDPAAQGAIQMIIDKYDEQQQGIINKNSLIFGSAVTNAARSGGLQFAPDMTTSFLTDEQSLANERLGDSVTAEAQALLKSNQAYQSGDVKALSDATNALEKATTDKINAVSKLLTATNNQVKQQQAQAKIDAAAKKQATSNDIALSKSLGASMASQIKEQGITDPAAIKAYVNDMATKYGITNPDVLNSALVTAQAADKKADLSAANTNSEIAKRGQAPKTGTAKGGKDGGYTYSADDISSYGNFLDQGGKGPDGTVYGGRGSDGYANTGTYVAEYNDWIKQGGTPEGFAKQFPVKTNVNPKDYGSLPAAIVPVKATSSGSTPYTG